jgi:DNA-binding GntR family transcriptional regulator
MASARGHRVLHQEIASDIRRLIISGALKPGDQLASVREMKRQYQVSDGTIQAALRVLREEGLIESFHGRGSFVTKQTARPESDADRFAALEKRVDQLECQVIDLQTGAASDTGNRAARETR